MAANDKPSIPWMLLRSSWLLLTLLPGPIATWLGFAIIGGVARRGSWFGLSAGFAAAAIVANLEVWGPWRDLVATLVYLAGIIAGLFVNPRWLRILWERKINGGATASKPRSRTSTWHRAPQTSTTRRTTNVDGGTMTVTTSSTTTTSSSSRSARKKAAAKNRAEQKRRAGERRKAQDAARAEQLSEAQRLLAEAGGSGDDLYEAATAPTAPAASAPSIAAEPVDVNTASARDIQDLPGMSRRSARAAVKQREDRGGFSSLDDFAAAAGLQPHEVVRLRTAATCSPPPSGPRTFGRRVDF